MVHGVTGAKRLLVQKQKSLQVGVETDLQNTVPDWLTKTRSKVASKG